jgi:hypothetical protein
MGGPNIQTDFVELIVNNAIDLIVHLEITRDGFRKVSEILPVSKKFTLEAYLAENKAS